MGVEEGEGSESFDATQQGRAGESSRVWISRLLLWLVLAAGAALSVRAVFRARLSGEGFWFPMSQALDLLRRVPDQRLYETLSLSRHVKLQAPPCACYAKLSNGRDVVGGSTALGGEYYQWRRAVAISRIGHCSC